MYNVGPGPDERALYLTFGTAPSVSEAVELEFFQFLPNLADDPAPGTYRAQDSAKQGTRLMSGTLLRIIGGKFNQRFPMSDSSASTVTEATSDCVSGSLSVGFRRRESTASTPEVTVHGSFVAERVQSYSELPHPVSVPEA